MGLMRTDCAALLTIGAMMMFMARVLPAAEGAAKPNMLILLADDLGYGDMQCNNPGRGKIPTPCLDRLASQGLRFTDGHASSGVCSPSRYTLLTGRYHWRSRLQNGIVGQWEKALIVPERMTLAGLVKQQGYRTACIGKWHLGWDWPIAEGEKPYLTGFGGKTGGGGTDISTRATDAHRAAWKDIFSKPIANGPTKVGFDSYFGTDVPNWPPYCFIENDRTVGIPSTLLAPEKLKSHQASLQGPALPDWPLEKILPTLGDRACAFLADAAAKPEPFLLYMPLTAPHTPLAVTDEWKGKSGLIPYADYVMQTDAVVGRVLEALEKSGAADRTLVVFTSDNGCAPYIGAKEMEAKGHYPSGPLRGYKSDAWEGGHRIPFVVRWPGVVKPGAVCGQLVHQADLMATFAEVLGAKLPDTAGEDSVSLLPLLKGGDAPVREHAVSCAASGVPALRQGPWKLIAGPAGGQPVQLYNLAEDLGEAKNLAADQPERVAAMKTLLEKLIVDGRSTPGAPQKNDVEVRRLPGSVAPRGKRAEPAGVAPGKDDP
jgi:arylsulfatase A-like enzyme